MRGSIVAVIVRGHAKMRRTSTAWRIDTWTVMLGTRLRGPFIRPLKAHQAAAASTISITVTFTPSQRGVGVCTPTMVQGRCCHVTCLHWRRSIWKCKREVIKKITWRRGKVRNPPPKKKTPIFEKGCLKKEERGCPSGNTHNEASRAKNDH